MAIVELDPLFIRALRLLHSKSKESDVQLKSILDESIRQRKAGLPINIPVPQVTASSSGSNVKEKEKNLDRLKRDLSQLVPGVPNKRPRIDMQPVDMPASSSGKMSSSSMTPSPTASLVVEEDTGDMDIDFQSLNDCTCFICKSFNQEPGNKLMECHTCQNLYHQKCHDPVISDEEASDPRLIWICSTCKPVQQTAPPKSSISGLSKSSSKSSSGSRLTSSSSSSSLPVDKRLQMIKKKSSSSSSSGNGSGSSRDRKSK